MTRYFITTAIDYANGAPHLGHAYEKIGADALARYRRLRGDRDLLFQALCNLLDNAIKYSHSGSEVTLETTVTDGAVNISVADRGPGVSPAERDKVVDRFYRSASVTGVPGSGLGLSLVNAIAHHHGGQLVLSDNAPGLRATLHLPGNLRSGATPVSEMAFAGDAR